MPYPEEASTAEMVNYTIKILWSYGYMKSLKIFKFKVHCYCSGSQKWKYFARAIVPAVHQISLTIKHIHELGVDMYLVVCPKYSTLGHETSSLPGACVL